MKKPYGLLPAVVLSLSYAQSAPAETFPAAEPAHASAAAEAAPAVMRFRAPGDRAQPQKLDAYTMRLSAKTGMLSLEPEGGPCGTISGSDFGWDDSDQDWARCG